MATVRVAMVNTATMGTATEEVMVAMEAIRARD